MTKTISINTSNLVHELQERELSLCYLSERGIFILDSNGRLFRPDAASHCFYIEHLIKREIANFTSTGYLPSKNEIRKYTIKEVKSKTK